MIILLTFGKQILEGVHKTSVECHFEIFTCDVFMTLNVMPNLFWIHTLTYNKL
jgi:hypothetical protein